MNFKKYRINSSRVTDKWLKDFREEILKYLPKKYGGHYIVKSINITQT